MSAAEETSLLESIEGRRGIVRAKPPLPPTRACRPADLINNVLSLASVPTVLERARRVKRDSAWGAPVEHADPACRNVKHGGCSRSAFGSRSRARDDIGGHGERAAGAPVQVGGPPGPISPARCRYAVRLRTFAARDA